MNEQAIVCGQLATKLTRSINRWIDFYWGFYFGIIIVCLFHYHWISTRYQWTDPESLWKDKQFLSADAGFWSEGRRLVPSAQADGSREGCCRGDARGSRGGGGEWKMRWGGTEAKTGMRRSEGEPCTNAPCVMKEQRMRNAKKGGEWRVEIEEINMHEFHTASHRWQPS